MSNFLVGSAENKQYNISGADKQLVHASACVSLKHCNCNTKRR